MVPAMTSFYTSLRYAGLLVVALTLAVSVADAAQIYTWVDSDGNLQMADDLKDVPETSLDDVREHDGRDPVASPDGSTQLTLLLNHSGDELSFDLPQNWSQVPERKFQSIADAVDRRGPNSRLLDAFEPAGSKFAMLMVTKMDVGKLGNAALAPIRDYHAGLPVGEGVEFHGFPIETVRYDEERHVIWVDVARRGESGVPTLVAMLLSDKGMILMQGMADDMPGFEPIFRAAMDSARLTDGIKYLAPAPPQHPAAYDIGSIEGPPIEPKPIVLSEEKPPAKTWGFIVGFLAGLIVCSVWARQQSRRMDARRIGIQVGSVLIAFVGMQLLTRDIYQAAAAGQAFFVMLFAGAIFFTLRKRQLKAAAAAAEPA